MAGFIEPIGRLINQLSKLPGVGAKTAQRYAYKIIEMSDLEAEEFAQAILRVKREVKYCKVCGNFSETDTCPICQNRSSDIICVVKEPKDVVAIEKSGRFDGVYHVLHGTINPMEGIGPNDIAIKELLIRLNSDNVKEVLIATNPDVEGEATAMYIAKMVKPLGIKVTRLAHGIAVGTDLEYADIGSLTRAILDRREM
ncbi:MAG: recombination protein RecR [Clostridia bacterium]|nr:recombination protein RecR [Clostridia bacterium]MBQ3495150.1 recombination protein RecR [Clostridia bacterium]MBR6688131.1 recombination protein RecR [Clostridia bacterium]